MNGLSCHVRSCGFKWSSLGLSALFTHPRQKKSLPFCSAVTSLSSPPHTRPFCPSCGTNTINNRVSGASPIGYAQPHHPEPKSGPAWNSEALGGSEAARDTEWGPPEETLFWPPDRPTIDLLLSQLCVHHTIFAFVNIRWGNYSPSLWKPDAICCTEQATD